MKKIVVIDDDLDMGALLLRYLKKKGFGARHAFSGNTGLQMLKKEAADVVLCDVRLPDRSGLELIEAIKQTHVDTQVIMITGYSDVQTAVTALKKGAFDYVTKPIHQEEILLTIKRALAVESSSNKGKSRHKQPKHQRTYLVGESLAAQQVDKLINLVAPAHMTVVITGESGTGKEVIANTIHNRSKRKNKPFVAVDCGALPENLASSELFGHVKGAFTGALADRAGHFETAHEGTLFLDEIGNLTYENQVKLLRVLQERQVRKVGSSKDVSVDVRIITATNEDLRKAVKEGKFREDLFYRLNEFKIEIPALRERQADIEEFARFFLEQANETLEKSIKKIDSKALLALQKHPWPGNLRELKNVMKRAALMAAEDRIEVDVLPREITGGGAEEVPMLMEDITATDLKTVVEHAEKIAITKALKAAKYNKSRAAKILQIDRKTLYNKLTAYQLESEIDS